MVILMMVKMVMLTFFQPGLPKECLCAEVQKETFTALRSFSMKFMEGLATFITTIIDFCPNPNQSTAYGATSILGSLKAIIILVNYQYFPRNALD